MPKRHHPFPLQSKRWLKAGFFVAFLLVVAACGGGGGDSGPPAEDNVSITGRMDDGSGDAPVRNALCRYVDESGTELHADITNAAGVFQLVIPPDTRGQIVCSPRNVPDLVLTTFSSTVGFAAGSTIEDENVTPATTVVADIIRQENPTDPESRKAELLNDIVFNRDANLAIVVALSERLYAALFDREINTSFNGEGSSGDGDGRGDGGGGGDGGGAGGDAGDGADFSPLDAASCEFVVGDSLTTGETVYTAALSDFMADGLLDRPDLAEVAAQVNEGTDPDQVKAAFADVFAEFLGQPVATVTDEEGRFFLPVPPDMAGYVRCTPRDREQLVLGAYFPGRSVGVTVDGVGVSPASTVFSTEIVPQLRRNLGTVQENYQADKAGLQVLLSGPNLPAGPLTGINLGTTTLPANSEVGLVAFAATGLFNAFNKNGFDVDLSAAISELRTSGSVGAGFLEAQGVPSALSQGLSDLIGGSISAAAGTLGTGLSSAWSTGRINVTVMNDADGGLVPDAAIGITNTDLTCANCDTLTDENGQLTVVVEDLGQSATEVEVAVSGVPGFATSTWSVEMAAFATVDLEIRLSTTSDQICSAADLSISPQRLALPQGGGTGSFDVSAPDDCTWTAGSGDNWITITAGDGSGDGSVVYEVSPNPGSTNRSGLIVINGSGQGHSVAQTWSDFIAEWNTADRFDGEEVYRVTVEDNADGSLRVQPDYWCDGAPACSLAVQTVDGPGAGPLTLGYPIATGTERIIELTLIGARTLEARHFIRFTVGAGTIDSDAFVSLLTPD